MNKKRRETLNDAVWHLISAQKCIKDAEEIIEHVQDEESDAMDNIPENLQSSDRYNDMEETVDKIDDAISDISDLSDNLNDIISSIRDILRG